MKIFKKYPIEDKNMLLKTHLVILFLISNFCKMTYVCVIDWSTFSSSNFSPKFDEEIGLAKWGLSFWKNVPMPPLPPFHPIDGS